MKDKQVISRGTVSRSEKKTRPVKTCPRCKRKTLRKTTRRSSSGKFRWDCSPWVAGEGRHVYCYSTVNPDAPRQDQNGNKKEADKNPQFRRALGGAKRFIITAAQNATPVHDAFFASLKQFSDHNQAELVVIPIRYKNATSRWTDSQANAEVWDPAVAKYLYNQRKQLNENLTLLSDIKTVPTATNPLSGFESITGGKSGILGHTKIQLSSIATPHNRYPKILTSTGAVTMKNYTDTKAGKKGEFHHSYAALVVEIIGKKFFMRHVNWDGSGFIDLNTFYSPEGVFDAPRPLALVLGDTHRATMCKTVEKATFAPGGMVETLNPEHLIFHDLHDGAATNHHTRKDPFAQVAKRVNLLHLVKEEILQDVIWLARVCKGRQGVIVPSNHDDFLARWLREQDWRLDPENAEFYLETALHMVREIKSGNAVPHPFTHWVNELRKNAPIRCLERDESFVLGGVELAMHGDKGANGSRGSARGLRRIGVKSIIGHSHSPAIEEGCYQAGTSTPLRVEYTIGPSSWQNAHVILYANGKRAILPIIDGLWSFDATKG